MSRSIYSIQPGFPGYRMQPEQPESLQLHNIESPPRSRGRSGLGLASAGLFQGLFSLSLSLAAPKGFGSFRCLGK